MRTVGRALAYWRACGVVALRRHQRLTAVKTVNVDAALQCAKEGVTLVKNLCAVARAAARRGLDRTFMAASDHQIFKSEPWRAGAPSEALKRLLK